jgi:hypothetical protein
LEFITRPSAASALESSAKIRDSHEPFGSWIDHRRAIINCRELILYLMLVPIDRRGRDEETHPLSLSTSSVAAGTAFWMGAEETHRLLNLFQVLISAGIELM